jgi:hypothetical protein
MCGTKNAVKMDDRDDRLILRIHLWVHNPHACVFIWFIANLGIPTIAN